MAKGILTKPPATTKVRVSPGVYKDVPVKASVKPAAKKKGKGGPANYQGLTKDQSAVINQRQGQDLQLGDYAGGQMQGIQDAYSQPFDWNQGPAAPVTGDYNQWVNQQMGNYNSAYDSRMKPVEAQQNDDFEQQMANRGIPMGSQLYNQQKQQLLQSQNDARTQAYASGQGQAVSSAQGLFNVGTQAHGNALSEAMSKRNMPLNEYNQIMAAQSGQGAQNLAYSQTLGAQNNAASQQIRAAKAMPHGGGGGGGGGGAMWQQYGFKSPQEYDAYKTAQARSNAQWDYANNPQYRQPQQASGWATGLGGILGGFAQGAGNAFGSWMGK